MKGTLVLALALVLLAWPAAGADSRGSDVMGNIGPSSQLQNGLADKYPLSAYALDSQIEVGVTDPDGIPALIAHSAAAQLWDLSSVLVKCTIDLFTWAFSLDLLNGPDGALGPVAQAITGLYENVIGQAWMVVAILLAGIWGIWKALVQRRYTETAGALGVSVLFVLIALFFVYQPERTVGQASQWTNTVSLAFLSGANRGSLDDPQRAKRQVADHLFETLVFKPWVVLEFGGLRHCVDTDQTDADGFPRPVKPDDPRAHVCRDHIRADRAGYGGYAPLFLREAPGSEERKVLSTSIAAGEVPMLIRAAGRNPEPIKVDKADAPAVDIQQEGGAFQRLTVALLVFAGALGAVVLLGFLSLAVILAQVVALVLLGFAPVALVIGIFPGAGHRFFRAWLSKLATALFIKVLYSLVIAIVVAVSAALTASTEALGFLFAFGLQTIFFWAIFIYRKQIANRLVAATTGSADVPGGPRMTTIQKGARAASKPFSALAGVTRPGKSAPQQSELRPDEDSPARSTSTPGPSEPAPRTADHETPVSDGNSTSPKLAPTGGPERTEPDRSEGGKQLVGAAAAVAVESDPVKREHKRPVEPTPRASHEDVMRRARALRDRQRETVTVEQSDV